MAPAEFRKIAEALDTARGVFMDPADVVAWLRGRTGDGGGFTSAAEVADAIERRFVTERAAVMRTPKAASFRGGRNVYVTGGDPETPAQGRPRQSPEYHAAHLAFSRTGIVEAAARRQPILDLLVVYTGDVIEAERDRAALRVTDRPPAS